MRRPDSFWITSTPRTAAWSSGALRTATGELTAGRMATSLSLPHLPNMMSLLAAKNAGILCENLTVSALHSFSQEIINKIYDDFVEKDAAKIAKTLKLKLIILKSEALGFVFSTAG